MRSESIYKLLREHAPGDVNEALLSFIVRNSNGHSILYMSQEQFCAAAGVSEEEAAAFFLSFGANSFLAFKRLLRECLYKESTELGTMDRSIASIADEVIRYEMQNLSDFSRSIDCTMIKRFAQDILNAGEVVLFTHSIYSPLVDYMAKMLCTLGIKFSIMSPERILGNVNLFNPPESSLIITFGFPRYSKASLLHLKHLKQQGARIVAVTDGPNSPFAFLSEYFFTVPLRSFDFTESYCGGMALVSILSLWIGILNGEDTFLHLQSREEIVDDRNMFLR